MKKVVIIILYVLFLLLINYQYAKSDWEVITPVIVPKQIVGDPLFERIAKCESNGDLHIKNKRSTASGEFQFTWNTWHHYGIEFWGDAFYQKNIWGPDNRELAWKVYKKYGTRDWLESKPCWNK